MTTRDRAFLIAPIATLRIADPAVESRRITNDDFAELAQLFLDAYAGSVDDEGETLDDAQAEIRRLLNGDSGEPRRTEWRGIYADDGALVSVILCTTYKSIPFIAHVLTQPSFRERGYATSLIREVAASVDAAGGTAIGLMVTRENPAVQLYRELGFAEMFSPS